MCTKIRIETNQSTNGKLSFFNIIGLFKKKIAIFCSQVTQCLVNSFPSGPVCVDALQFIHSKEHVYFVVYYRLTLFPVSLEISSAVFLRTSSFLQI